MSEQGCIKTGANLMAVPYGEVWHGDLYRVGDTYIFKQGGEPGPHPSIHIRAKDWYALGSVHGRIIAFTPEMVEGEFSYNGERA